MKTWMRALCASAAMFVTAGGAAAPVLASQAPVTGSRAPVAGSQASASSSQTPVANSQTPAASTQASATSSQASAQAETTSPGMGSASTAEEWYETSAPALVRERGGSEMDGFSEEDIAALEVGTPIRAFAFSEVSDSGDSSPSIVESNHWVAPLRLGGEPVATLGITFEDGEASAPVFTDNASFAAAIDSPESGSRIVVEPSIQGWFIVFADQTVSPLDPKARQVLAGLVPLSDFEDIRRNYLLSERQTRTSAGASASDAGQEGAGGATGFIVLGLAGAVAAAGVIFWLRYESNRKAADEQEPDPPPEEPAANGTGGPRTFLTETGEMVRIYERPRRTKDAEAPRGADASKETETPRGAEAPKEPEGPKGAEASRAADASKDADAPEEAEGQ